MRPDPAGPLALAAARRHELTRARAIQALRELDRAGAPVTFASVAAAAGFSELGRCARNCLVRAYLWPPASLMALVTR
jgi:hypothetical protein